MKKALLFLLTIMMLGFVAAPVSAQTVWDGSADISWYDASETSFDISTPEQLAGVAQLVNSGATTFNGATLHLVNDLWLNFENDSTNNWTPIGGSATATTEDQYGGNSFKGAFNGHGHTIYNLYCEKTNYFHAGLFGCIQNPCTIDSLVMINPTVKSCGMMGVIAGMSRSGGAIYIRYCLVVNANVVGTPSGTGPSASHNNIGCIVGANYPNTGGTYIQNCGATGSLSGFYIGGIGGNAQYDYITNCYFAGTLTPYNTNYGGMTAHDGTRTNCYSYTIINGNLSQSSASSHGTSVTQDVMQSEEMITNLGDAFKMDNGVNNGYPIMSYMAGVDPIAAEICQGESITITAFGYDSYVWSNGSTSESITVSPSSSTTYTVTGTLNGVSATHTSTITVFPQAVITAEVAASADGQTHGTISPESATVACLSSDNVTFTVTPDANYRVSRVTLNGAQIYGDEFGEGQVTLTVNPNGTLGTVKVFLSNEYTISILELQDTGDTLHVPSLVQPYGNNGVFTAIAGSNQTFNFNNTARYALTDAEIDGASQGVIYSYDFIDIHENHSIVVTYVDSCGIFGLPFFEDFESVSSGIPECYAKNNGNSSYPTVNNYYPYQGKSIYVYNYSYGEASNEVPCLILPKVDEQFLISELMVQFYGRASSADGYFVLGVMTDPTDMSTFTAVQTITPTNTSGVYQPYTAYLGNYQGEGHYIAIKMPVTAYCLLGIDNLSVDYAPLCSPISNLTVSDIFGSNATLTWSPTTVGEVSEYNIYVYDNATETESTYTTSETSYLLTGLSELTQYTVGVYTSCTNGQTSDTTFINFMTPCNSPVNITIGNGTSTTTYFPTYSCYENSYTQQIIPASAIGTDPMEFSSIFFQCTSVASDSRIWDIYVSPVPSTMDLSSGWILPSEEIPFHLVKSGTVSISSSGTDYWFEVPLDSTLVYNGTDNLLISILDHTGSWSCSNSYRYHSDASTSNMSRYAYRDGTAYDPAGPDASGYVSSNVANIRFTFCDESSCLRPNTLAVGAVDPNSAELSWFNPNPTQNCEIEYKTASDAEWTSAGSVSGSDYTLSGLESNTLYQVRVRALCGSDEVSLWSESISFRTECDAISNIPYVQNFDTDVYGSGTDAYIYCWNRYTSDPSKPVYLYPTSAAHTTPNALRFYDGAGVTNIAIMPKVDESISLSELEVSFWVRNTSASSPAIFELGVMTDNNDPATFETLDTIQIVVDGENYNHIEYSMANYSGSGQYVAFRVSNGNGGNNIRLDDVALNYIPLCLHPVNLTIGGVTSESVTLQWSEMGGASSWVIEYGPAGFTPGQGEGNTENANDTIAVIYGLNPNTLYDFYVYSDCGGGFLSTPVTVSARTDCGPTTITAETPWFEDFESYTGSGAQLFVCWATPVTEVVDNGTSPFVYCGHAPSCHSGSNSAELKGTNNMLVLPEFTNDIHTLRLSFWATTTNTSNYGTVEIGVVTDASDPTSFEVLGLAGVPGPRGGSGSGHGNFMGPFDFNGVQASSGRIAIRFTGYSGLSWNVDDVTVGLTPGCPSPVKTSVTASNIDGHNATISFVDNDPDHNSWTVFYREHSAAADDPWMSVVTSTTTVDLNNLDPETQYDVYVITNCTTPDEVADATNTIQFTTSVACPAPQNITVSATTDEAVVTWFGTADSYIVTCGDFTATVTETTVTITGLNPASNYTVSITADCGTEGTSSAGTASFMTACDVISVFPYNEGFESGQLGCWTQETITGNNAWTISSSYYNSGTHGVGMSYTNNTSSRLISPIFDLTSVTNPMLSFYRRMHAFSGTIDTIGLYYRTSITDEWMWFAGFNQVTNGFEIDSVALPNPSASYQVAIVGYAMDGWGIYLDDIQVYDGSGSGPVLTDPTVTTSAATDILQTSATLNGTINNPDNVTITAKGFEWKTSVGGTYSPVTVTGNNLTYNLTNLTANTGYTYKAFITFNGTTVYGDELTFTTLAQSQPADPTVATNAANPIAQTTATLNATITNPDNVTVTAKGFEWKATTGGTYTSVAGTGTGNTFSANLSGLTANTGYTYKAFITFNGTTVYGSEMTFTTLPEDTPEPCETPTNLHASEFDAHSITIGWNANANATSWNIRYRVENGSWTSATSNTNTYVMSGLTAETVYEIQVQANCGNGNLSEWCDPIHISTSYDGINSWLENSVSLFPNPAREYIDIRVDGDLNITMLEVYDVYGKLINTVNVIDNPTRINVNGLASGMYFVRVTMEKGTVTKTFIKK